MTAKGMQVFQLRLDSFSSAKRVKNPSFTSSSAVKWPHPKSYAASPNSLAEAGFYFNPSWDDRDNVTCFMCGKELSDWTELDDPFEIHWEKCSASCVWAVVRCGLKTDVDSHGRFVSTNKSRLPAGKAMEKARLATFTTNGWWPHDALKNHGANSEKMAQAGFVYTPQIADDGKDDTATCLYCNIALGGWDPDDNPLKEHRQREMKSGAPCPFFALTSESLPATATSSKPLSRARAKKAIIEASEGEDEPSDDELELAPSAPKRKGRATSTAAKSKTEGSTRRVTRGAGSRAGSVMEEEEEMGKTTAKSKGKGRGRKKKQEVIEEENEVAPETVVEKPKRGRPRKTAMKKEEPVEDAVNPEPELDAPAPPAKPASKPKSTTSKSTSKAKGGRKKQTVVEEAGMEVDEEEQGSVEVVVQAVDRKGKGKERDMKVVDISTDDEARERVVTPEPEPERKTTKGKKKASVEIEHEQPEPESMDIHPAPSTPPRPVLSPSPQRTAPALTNGYHHPPSPASPPQPSSQAQTFLPPLALLPIPHIVSLSETEQDMTVEEWIRQEISLQYEQLKSDGERRIDAFRERAEEVRRRIDAL